MLAAWAFCCVPAVALPAGPDIFLVEEPERYVVADKLEGMGYLPDLMTGDRPLEAREAAREASKAGSGDDPLTDGMLRFLALGAELRYDFRLRAGAGHSEEGSVPPNAQGFPVPKDGGARLGGFFRAAPYDWLALQGRGDFQADAHGERFGRVEETSIRLGFPQATLEGGRFSLWWGPGRHGSLLFTTNAEPLIGVRLRNPRPIAIGWPLRFLGLFQYDLFVARLDGDRPVPHPLLSGIRLALKPASWLELGVSRAFQFGGEGHDQSFGTYLDIFTGKRESVGDTPVGNSLASFDAKIRLPFRLQPIVLYGEAGGEDQSRPGVPSRWAWMGGVFLPSIGPIRKADLRIEYSTTLTHGEGVWYQHPDYPHQYRGRILGHPMGTDAQDLFVEVR